MVLTDIVEIIRDKLKLRFCDSEHFQSSTSLLLFGGFEEKKKVQQQRQFKCLKCILLEIIVKVLYFLTSLRREFTYIQICIV